MGSLVNNSFLVNAKKVDLDWMTEYNCLQVMRIPQIDMSMEKVSYQTREKEFWLVVVTGLVRTYEKYKNKSYVHLKNSRYFFGYFF